MLKDLPRRGSDAHGQGHYGASRGTRKHAGEDLACYAGHKIRTLYTGVVSKIGYPYHPDKYPEKAHLRYVQITSLNNLDFRYFYVLPFVKVGEQVQANQIIGEAQDLTKIYQGITNHIHFEIRKQGYPIDPNPYLESDIFK